MQKRRIRPENAFPTARKCREIFYTFDGQVQCNLADGHDGKHRGRTRFSRKWIYWTNEEAQESVEPLQHTTPLIGWRTWIVRGHGAYARGMSLFSDAINTDTETFLNATPWTLQSVTSASLWVGPIMTTKNRWKPLMRRGYSEVDHPVDHGVYSYKCPERLRQKLLKDHTLHYYSVFGMVENTGTVIEHEYGWRSQVTKVSKLWLFPQVSEEWVPKMEQQYGVDVVRLREKEAFRSLCTFLCKEHCNGHR